jgi:hypothetical protein
MTAKMLFFPLNTNVFPRPRKKKSTRIAAWLILFFCVLLVIAYAVTLRLRWRIGVFFAAFSCER